MDIQYFEITAPQLFCIVAIVDALTFVLLFFGPLLFSLLELLLSSKQRWSFICDMQEYEYMLKHGYPLPYYLRNREFLILVKLYHKLYDKKDKKEIQE